MIGWWQCEAWGEMRTGRENWHTQIKPTPVSLRALKIPHNQTWDRTEAAKLGTYCPILKHPTMLKMEPVGFSAVRRQLPAYTASQYWYRLENLNEVFKRLEFVTRVLVSIFIDNTVNSSSWLCNSVSTQLQYKGPLELSHGLNIAYGSLNIAAWRCDLPRTVRDQNNFIKIEQIWQKTKSLQLAWEMK
jgi:hypothetical protein